jgi:hypothetical protein
MSSPSVVAASRGEAGITNEKLPATNCGRIAHSLRVSYGHDKTEKWLPRGRRLAHADRTIGGLDSTPPSVRGSAQSWGRPPAYEARTGTFAPRLN